MEKDFFKLARFQQEDLPVMVIRNIIDFVALAMEFPKIAVAMLDNDAPSGFTEEDFTVERHSFIFGDSKPFYVAVIEFPFAEERKYVGLARRAYLVASEDLKGFHCYLEVYRELVAPGNPFYKFEILYMFEEDGNLFSSPASMRAKVDPEDMAWQCALWAAWYERNGRIGDNLP